MGIVLTCITWSHEQKWYCTHLVLECWNISLVGTFVHFFYPWGPISYGALVHSGYSLYSHVITWTEWGCPQMYQMITCTERGLYTLSVTALKYFLGWGFSLLWILFLGLLYCGAFAHWGFSLSNYVITWTEQGLFTPVSRDHMNKMLNVHTCITWSHEQNADCTPWVLRVLKYFLDWGFCPMMFCPMGFCPFGLFSVPNMITWTERGLSTPVSRDHMNRKGIVLPFFFFFFWGGRGGDCTSWVLRVLKYFLGWGFCPLRYLSLGLLS